MGAAALTLTLHAACLLAQTAEEQRVLSEAAQLLDAGSYAQALSLLQPLALPPSGAYYSLLGAAQAGLGQVVPAVQSLQTALHLEPNNENHCLDLARLLGENGAQTASIELLQWAVKAHPASPRLHVGLALALLADGRTQAAREAADTALTLDSKLETAYTTLALVLEDDRDWAAMLAVARRLQALNPHNHLAFYYEGLALGSLAEGAPSLQSAEVALRRSIQLNSRYGLAHFQLAKLLLSAHGQQAISELEKAITLDPNFAEAHFLLGRALAKAGQAERSAKHLEIHRRLMTAQVQEKPRLEVTVNVPK